MRSLPEAFQERELIACLAEGWGLNVQSMRYAPVGGGSYHWEVADAAGRRHFVTVDDLDHKGWLGHDRDSAFDGLRGAFVILRGEEMVHRLLPLLAFEEEVCETRVLGGDDYAPLLCAEAAP